MNRAPHTPDSGRILPLDWPQAAGNVEPVLAAVERHAQRRRRRWLAADRAALILLVVGIATRGLWQSDRDAVPGRAGAALVSQPERQVLPDGSVAELRADAAVAIDFQPELRRIVLERGEAFFQVTKDPARPFVVDVGGVAVRAVGTAFAARRRANGIEVLVTEGRVAVGGTALVGAGERLVIDGAIEAARPVPISETEMREALEWRVPRLEFNGAPLAEVVALFNRHAADPKQPRLVLADGQIAALPLSGVLRADNLGVLLTILDMSYGVKSRPGAAGELVLHRAQ